MLWKNFVHIFPANSKCRRKFSPTFYYQTKKFVQFFHHFFSLGVDMSVEISADTAVVMKVKGQYLAVNKTAKRFPRSQTRSPGFVLSQLAVLRTTRYSHLRSLRSGAATRLIIPMERDTFQDSAAKLFNVLPSNIRNCSDFKVQCREVNAYLLNNICREQIVSVRRRSLTRLAKLWTA